MTSRASRKQTTDFIRYLYLFICILSFFCKKGLYKPKKVCYNGNAAKDFLQMQEFFCCIYSIFRSNNWGLRFSVRQLRLAHLYYTL